MARVGIGRRLSAPRVRDRVCGRVRVRSLLMFHCCSPRQIHLLTFLTLSARGSDGSVSRDGSSYIQCNVPDLDLHRLSLRRLSPSIRHSSLQPSPTPSSRHNRGASSGCAGWDVKTALAGADAGALQIPSTRLRAHPRSSCLSWLTLPPLLICVTSINDNA